MKAVMISIQPKWVEKIANGEKTIEVRKSRPKIDTPFKVYIYKTKKRILRDITKKGELGYYAEISDKTRIISCPDLDGGKVIGEFVCDKIYNFVQFGAGIMFADENLNLLEPQLARDMTCLTDNEIENYLGNKDGYGLHISNLKIYDKPKELSEFNNLNGKPITRAFQSWGYVEILK